MKQFPPTLLNLTDDQLAKLMAAAEPLQRAQRSDFLREVAAKIGNAQVGDGALHRVLRDAQKKFLGERMK